MYPTLNKRVKCDARTSRALCTYVTRNNLIFLRNREITKSNFYKLWLIAFVAIMAYRLYWIHAENVELPHSSFFVCLLSGIAIYLFGTYKLKIIPSRNWSHAAKALFISLGAIVLGSFMFLFSPKLAGTLIMAIWFYSLFISEENHA